MLEKFDMSKVDTARLEHPFPLFQMFAPTEEKLKDFVRKLIENYLYISDEYRNEQSCWALIYKNASNFSVLYEIGNWDGLMGFTDVIPGWRAYLMLKLWNPKLWGPDFARQGKDLIRYIMDTFNLSRVSLASPDARMIKMSKMAGLREEGLTERSFRWDGDYYDETLLALIRRD
jgi:RimJ/RimL family protein N-acetyltransferase